MGWSYRWAYYKNRKLNFEREDFKRVYDIMCKCMKNSNNLVFKIKYFKNINFESYEEFIKSIVKVSKTICSAYSKLPFDLKLYSLNYDACMICTSDSPIKSGSDIVNVIYAKEGCPFLYSPIKIIYSKEDDILSTTSNTNIIYFPRYLNTLKKQKDTISLNLYEESYSIDKINGRNFLIVDNFNLSKSIKYKFSDMVTKEKE